MLINRDRALGVMADFNIDALLATAPPNVTYMSDCSPWHQWFYRQYTAQHYMYENYALFPRDQSTTPALILLVDGANETWQAQWPSWIQDLYPYGSSPAPGEAPPADYPAHHHRLHQLRRLALEKGFTAPGEALVRALRDRGLTHGALGVDAEGMQPAQLEYARRELPDLQFKEAGEVFRYIRMVKTPEQIAVLRKAGEINRKGFESLLKAAVPGATENDLRHAHRAGVSLAGGVPVFCNAACGPLAITHWEPSDNTLKPGDTVYCDAGCTYWYHHADGNRVAVLGEPTRRHREIFDSLQEGIDAAIARARPGVRVSKLLEAFSEATLRSGALKTFSGFGHAIGLEARDLPMIEVPWRRAQDAFLDISHDLPLEAGMVFNMEQHHREIGVGSIALEVTLLATPTGCEPLVPGSKLEVLPV